VVTARKAILAGPAVWPVAAARASLGGMGRGFRTAVVAVAVCLVPPLAGCTARYRSDSVAVNGGAVASTHLDVSSRSVVGAAIIVGIVAADGFRYYRVEADGSRTPIGYAPPSDPDRRISVQDCTRPVDPAAGNLVCR
jgi:hypothetical protein